MSRAAQQRSDSGALHWRCLAALLAQSNCRSDSGGPTSVPVGPWHRRGALVSASRREASWIALRWKERNLASVQRSATNSFNAARS